MSSQVPDTDTQLQGYLRQLHRNIVMIIISVSVIPLIVVSVTIYGHFRLSYREKVKAHLQELVFSHATKIDAYLEERLGNIRFLAASSEAGELLNTSVLQNRLAELQGGFGRAFVDLGLIAEDGHQVAYAGPFKLAEADYSGAAWFRTAIQSEAYISDVFLGIRGQPHFIVAVRWVWNDQPWLLRATIDFAAFNTLVERIGLGETGFAFILNRRLELQTTAKEKLAEEMSLSPAIYAELMDHPAPLGQKPRVQVREDSSGRENIYVAAVLKSGEWMLVYQQRTAEAYADLKRAFLITTVLMAAGLTGIVGMALALSRTVVNRVARADREKQMLNRKVVETGKLASLGELAAGIAHEINNPVAIMVEEAGWMEDLLEDVIGAGNESEAEFRRAIAQIRTQGRRCKEITHKLLSFARKTDDTPEDVHLPQLLEEIIALSERRARYAMIDIRREFQAGLPPLRASVTEVQQVFFNLINNAIDAMENSGGTLSISARRQENQVAVAVSDTGGGIPEANLERIFDPFFTTKGVGKGTGLGLSICYGIVDKLGGKIEVQSAVGKGSTFTVYFPLPEDDPAPRQAAPAAAGDNAPRGQTS